MDFAVSHLRRVCADLSAGRGSSLADLYDTCLKIREEAERRTSTARDIVLLKEQIEGHVAEIMKIKSEHDESREKLISEILDLEQSKKILEEELRKNEASQNDLT